MKEKISKLILLGIGVIIILIGIIVQINNTKYLKSALTTEAVITDIKIDIDDDYEVHIAYNVNNVNYNGLLDEYNSGMRIGQKITIYYNPENPSECRGKSTDFVGFLVIGFGVVWIVFIKIVNKYS